MGAAKQENHDTLPPQNMMLLFLPLAILWGHFPEGTMQRDRLTEGLCCSGALCCNIHSFAGAYLILAQLKLLTVMEGPIFAVQFTTLILVRWAFEIYRKCNPQE